MKKRLTMREAILYKLLQNMWSGKDEYIPVHEFMGDIYCEELNLGGFVSHECSARLSEINTDNPLLLEIKKQKAKYTPNSYFCYRIKPEFTPDMLTDANLRAFYDKLMVDYAPRVPIERQKCEHGLPVFVKCPECNK